MDQVLVTGGAGFIGSHIVTRLVHDGFAVTVLDNLSTGHRANLDHVASDVEIVEGDVRDDDLVRRLVAGRRWVFHEAAIVSVQDTIADPVACHEVNGTATFRLLEACRAASVERFMFAASAAAYGWDESVPKFETAAPAPMSPYAVAKLMGEQYCQVYSSLYGLACYPLRYFNIFGPRQDPAGAYAAVISKYLERMSRGERPIIFGDGLQTRDFCYVDDVVQANLLAARATSGAGDPINVGAGGRITLIELVSTFNDVLGTALEPDFREARAGDVRHSQADITRARTLLGYSPRWSLRSGLGALVEHVRSGR